MSQTQLASVSRGNSLVLQILIGILAGGVFSLSIPRTCWHSRIARTTFRQRIESRRPHFGFSF